jgi:hypothetical protein
LRLLAPRRMARRAGSVSFIVEVIAISMPCGEPAGESRKPDGGAPV